MIIYFKFILFSVISVASCQTHFTLPKNVWRISLERSVSKDRWIGRGGKEGLPHEFFSVRAPFFGTDSMTVEGSVTNPRRRKIQRKTSFTVEYGTARRFTFVMEIPYYNSLSVENQWGWTDPIQGDDTAVTVVDSLIDFYHPDRSGSGLGDIAWRFNVLLFGSPAWSGESIMSIYGGIGMSLPTGRVIGPFDESDVDTSGRPSQFNQLSFGEGVTQWQISLFGEFYREILRRLIRVNWKVEYWLNIEGKFWTRVTPRGMFTLNHDSMLKELGRVYRLKPGDRLAAEISGFLELIPDRLSVNAGQSWFFKGRDRYRSGSERWDEWMEGSTEIHEDYDTRALRITQSVSVLLHNIHPLKKIGPVPFEVEATLDMPVLTRFSWRQLALLVSMSVYFQFY